MSSFKVNFKCKPFEFNCEVPVTIFGLPDIREFIPKKDADKIEDIADTVEAVAKKNHINLSDVGGALATAALFTTSICLSAMAKK